MVGDIIAESVGDIIPEWVGDIPRNQHGDAGGWRSKFYERGSFGRDGKFTPHSAAT